MDIKQSIILAPYTYFKLGGPADYFVEVKTKQELIEAISFAIDQDLPYFVLGGGSNILVSDKGFRGLVIKNKATKIETSFLGGKLKKGDVGLDHVIINAESGVLLNQLITYTINKGLAGLEDFLGLPGTVGGAVYNNSHHLGDLIGNHIHSVELFTPTKEIIVVPAAKMNFAYDYSRLHKTKDVVLSASFNLTIADKEKLLQKSRAAVARRAKTQPLGVPSSGCIFQNISLADAIRLGTPNHTLSAGYLIDHANLKGVSVGGAYISKIHANFIVNDGTATTKDVLDLIQLVKDKIKQTYGVNLKEEVFFVGEK